MPVGKGYQSINDSVGHAAVDSNGRLVIVGGTNAVTQMGNRLNAAFLIRLNTSGSLDTTFGKSGRVLNPLTGVADGWSRVRIDANSAITVAGNDAGPAVLATFTSAGVRTSRTPLAPTNLSGDGGWIFQPDGKLVGFVHVSGTAPSYGDFAAYRYLTNGTLDPTFGTGGIVVTDVGTPLLGYTVDNSERPNAIALDAAGNILVAGTIWTRDADSNDSVIVRYTSSGVVDPTFGNNGALLNALSPRNDGYSAVAVQGDGKIIAAGSVDVDSSPSSVVNNVVVARLADVPTVSLARSSAARPAATVARAASRRGDMSEISLTTGDSAPKVQPLRRLLASRRDPRFIRPR
jgi:uncharacterized delta-60 repeat protein